MVVFHEDGLKKTEFVSWADLETWQNSPAVAAAAAAAATAAAATGPAAGGGDPRR